MYTCRVAAAATAPPFWGNLTYQIVPNCKPGQLATNVVGLKVQRCLVLAHQTALHF